MKIFKKISPLNGLVVLLITFIITLFIATPIQISLGMYGLAITEIIILLIGLLSIIVHKISFRDVLPIKKVKIKQVLGIVLLWIGSYIIVITITLIQNYYFPNGISVGQDLHNFFTSVPIGISLFIVAVMPAICEEVLFRGFILTTFKNVKNKMVIILCVGIMFGVFHVDIYRIVPTAVLGIILTYIMIKTKNILLPILFHFINNFIPTLITFNVVEGKSGVVNAQMIIVFVLISLTIAPLVCFFGSKLLNSGVHRVNEIDDFNLSNNMEIEDNYKNKFKISYTLIGIIIFLIIVVILIYFNKIPANNSDTIGFKDVKFDKNTILDLEINKKVNCNSKDIYIPFTIINDGEYKLDCNFYNERGKISFIIIDKNDNKTHDIPGQFSQFSGGFYFYKGQYKIHIEFHLDDIDTFYKECSSEQVNRLRINEDLTTLSNFYIKVKISDETEDFE